MHLRPLTDTLGLEVSDVDVRTLSTDQLDKVKRLFAHHLVLLFRGQELDETQQLKFASRFGEIGTRADASNDEPLESRATMYVANRDVAGRPGTLPHGEMFFHFDRCWLEDPYSACFLYAIAVPSRGGHTKFANSSAGYERLSNALKAQLAEMDAVHSYNYLEAPTKRGDNLKDGAHSFVHPVVTVLPDSGKRVLFVNRLMTSRIVGLEKKQSDELLAELFSYGESESLVYEHVWLPGDLIVWDNRAVMHARTDFSSAEARILRRVSVKGSPPIGAQRSPKT